MNIFIPIRFVDLSFGEIYDDYLMDLLKITGWNLLISNLGMAFPHPFVWRHDISAAHKG